MSKHVCTVVLLWMTMAASLAARAQTNVTTTGGTPIAVSNGNVATSMGLTGTSLCGGQTSGAPGEFCIDAFPVSGGAWGGVYNSSTAYPFCTAVTYRGETYINGSQAALTGIAPRAGNQWIPLPYSTGLGASAPPAQADCADAAALSWALSNGWNATLVVGARTYTTNAGIYLSTTNPIAPSVSLIGKGRETSRLLLQASNSVGTVILPEPTSGGHYKNFHLQDLEINANWKAPATAAIVGNRQNTYIARLQLTNALGGPAMARFGTNNNVNGLPVGWGNQEVYDDLVTGYLGCPNAYCGGAGAAGKVAISRGAPSFTITAGGSNYTTYAQGSMICYSANGINSAIYPVKLTVANGVVTRASSTAKGLSGTCYLSINDQPQSYGLEFDGVSDSSMKNLVPQTGGRAGLYLNQASNNDIYGTHSQPNIYGLFGVIDNNQTSGVNTFYGTNLAEAAFAEFDIAGLATSVIGGNYYSSVQYGGQAMFRLENPTSKIWARDIKCSDRQAAEYHTLVTPNGIFDSVSPAMFQAGYNSLRNVEYCGAAGNDSNAMEFTSHPTWAAGVNSTDGLHNFASGVATPSANHAAPTSRLACGNYWNGSAPAPECLTLQQTFGTGTNPSVTYTWSRSGTSGAAAMRFPYWEFGAAALTSGTGTYIWIPSSATGWVGASSGGPVLATNTYGCLDGYDHLPCTVATQTVTGLSGSTSPATLFSPSSTQGGTYRVIISGRATTTGSAGTATYQLNWTDSIGATNASASGSVTNTSWASTALDSKIAGGSRISYQVKFNSVAGSPVAELSASVERVQ